MKGNISEKEIRTHLSHNTLPIYIFDKIDSTNSFAKTLSEDFALVVADSQTQGRGRLGRSFYSPSGSGVYMTLLAQTAALYQHVAFITTAAACATHSAIYDICGKQTHIKWVNDIYIGRKKVAGILCEAIDSSRCAIGIGINLYTAPFPSELASIASGIMDTRTTITREAIIAAVTDKLLDLLSALPDISFMEYYKQHSCVLGKRVLCTDGNKSFEATAIDIDPYGGLVVHNNDGIITLRTGEITLRFID